jgi:hypothetical protein
MRENSVLAGISVGTKIVMETEEKKAIFHRT